MTLWSLAPGRKKLFEFAHIRLADGYVEHGCARNSSGARIARASAEGNRTDIRRLLHGQLLRIGGEEILGKGLMWGRLDQEERTA